jgi:serine/threonine protein kinase
MSQIGHDVGVYVRHRLGHRMRIHEVIRESGPEVLVTARDLNRHVQVVLKILMLNLETAADALSQFEQEAAIAARLRHLNIAAVEAPERCEDLAYYAMNLHYVGSLEALLTKQPPPTLEESFVLLRDVASALDFAHARLTVHGRLAPSMILLDADDQVILSGFGSSVGPGAATYGISPAYMAPEQWPNLPGDGGRVDVYALGVIAFELLSGKRRNLAFTPSEFLEMEPFAIPVNTPLRKGLSLGINEAIVKAISNRPALRFASAGEFVDALEQTPALRGFRLTRQPDQRSPTDQSQPPTSQSQKEGAHTVKRDEEALRPSPLAASPIPLTQLRQPSSQLVRQPPRPRVQPPSPRIVIQPSSQPQYKPVYRASHQEDSLQWKPPQHKIPLSAPQNHRRGEQLKMFVMTVVFLIAMAALSGPDFLQAVASRTGLSFLGPRSTARTSKNADHRAVATSVDSSLHEHSRSRHGAKSSTRVPRSAKSNSVAESPSATPPGTSVARYGFVRVVLPGESQPVLIDGLPRGNTPLLARLPAGTHLISLVATRVVRPSQVSLILQGGDTVLASFSTEP